MLLWRAGWSEGLDMSPNDLEIARPSSSFSSIFFRVWDVRGLGAF